MVIKCEKKTIEESQGQRKLNIRGNKETRAMWSWKEGWLAKEPASLFSLVPSLLF